METTITMLAMLLPTNCIVYSLRKSDNFEGKNSDGFVFSAPLTHRGMVLFVLMDVHLLI